MPLFSEPGSLNVRREIPMMRSDLTEEQDNMQMDSPPLRLQASSQYDVISTGLWLVHQILTQMIQPVKGSTQICR
jgi:hypothetical protein